MHRRGFTLLELVVATAIMGIAVVGLLAGLSGAARNAARLRESDRAVQLAQMQMNQLLLDENLPRGTELQGEFDRGLTGGVETGWRARVTPFEMPPALAPGQRALDRVELEVWWKSGSEHRTFSLDAYRQRSLRPEDIPPPQVVSQ